MEFVMKDYLGDGVYGMFDGYAIWLHTNDPTHPSDRICLEPSVLNALNGFAERCAAAIAEPAAQPTTSPCCSGETPPLPEEPATSA